MLGTADARHQLRTDALGTAAKRMGVQVVREGFGRGATYYWQLPERA